MYTASMDKRALKAAFSAEDLVNVDRFCIDAETLLVNNNALHRNFAVQLLLREGLNNAVIHGCHQDAARSVTASVAFSDSVISIEIEDNGAGFDWRKRMLRATDDDATSGRGFEIFKRYATEFCYNERGNQLSFRVRIA